MAQFGVYPSSPPVAIVTDVVPQAFAFVNADTELEAVALAVKRGAVQPGEVCAIDLSTAARFHVEVESNITVVEEDVQPS
jgi:hypothetical protein